jgi:hypothetical protein
MRSKGMLYRKQATFVLEYAGVGEAPDASGVYTIFSSRRWLYIGESDDIRQSLYRHLNEPTRCMNKFGPLSFSFELEGRARRRALWQSLVTRLKTECNQVPSLADGRHDSWLGRLWSVLWGRLRHSGPRPFKGRVSPGPAAIFELGVTSETVVERRAAFLR